jgi:hypothetical protein
MVFGKKTEQTVLWLAQLLELMHILRIGPTLRELLTLTVAMKKVEGVDFAPESFPETGTAYKNRGCAVSLAGVVVVHLLIELYLRRRACTDSTD